MTEQKGERFGRYEILGELGRGAMGIVYKARDPKINRVVAVKTVSLAGQRPEDEAEYRERFYREAEAAGRLSHPGIVTIFDVGEEPESRSPYIVMEYVAGPSLDKLLSGESRTLPLETALQLTLELAEALDCAHGQGVVHRDLKPGNILITEEGHAKIADFGVAKLNLANLTLAGRTLGTPAYMSPEQLSGDAVDGRSDLFSLGVILYSILTGYRPFQGNSALTVSFKVVNREPIPASVLDTDLPPSLDYIISRAMAKDPAQRYQRGMELVLDIQELRAGREPWSKTKQPGPHAIPDAGKPANIKAIPLVAAANAGGSTIKRNPALGKDVMEKLLATMRKNSVASAALLLGLIILALGLSFNAWPRKKSARSLSDAAQAKSLSSEGAPSIPAITVQPPATEPQPVAVATEKAHESAPAHTAESKTSHNKGIADSETITKIPSGESDTASIKSTSTDNAVAHVTPVKTAGESPSVRLGSPNPASSNRSTHESAAGSAAPKTSRPSAPTIPPATLDVEINHRFSEAQLLIWVDDNLAYSHQLEGVDKQRLKLFHHVEGHEIHALQIAPGTHHLKVQVTSTENSYDESSTADKEFVSGKEAVLQIGFGKHGDLQLTMQ